MMLDTILGNAQVVDDLRTALRADRLVHSVLLCGEAGTGTGYAARCLAADYLYPNADTDKTAAEGAAQVMANESPEYLVLSGEGVSGDIKIDAVRAVRRAVFNTSLSARGRVVHLSGADHLNTASANALLKVLEEPPEGVLFLLTAPGEAGILPTIRSRCACYSLAPVSEAVCAHYLEQRFAAMPNAKRQSAEYAALFGGKIGSGVRCFTDAGARAQLDAAKQLADAVQAKEPYLALCLLAKYEKDRTAARSVLSLLCAVCAAALRGAYPVPAAPLAAAAISAVQKADARLAGNGNAKLVLTCLAGDLTPDA